MLALQERLHDVVSSWSDLRDEAMVVLCAVRRRGHQHTPVYEVRMYMPSAWCVKKLSM